MAVEEVIYMRLESLPQEWLDALGVKDGGLANLIRASYKALGLRTYFTTGACSLLKLSSGLAEPVGYRLHSRVVSVLTKRTASC